MNKIQSGGSGGATGLLLGERGHILPFLEDARRVAFLRPSQPLQGCHHLHMDNLLHLLQSWQDVLSSPRWACQINMDVLQGTMSLNISMVSCSHTTDWHWQTMQAMHGPATPFLIPGQTLVSKDPMRVLNASMAKHVMIHLHAFRWQLPAGVSGMFLDILCHASDGESSRARGQRIPPPVRIKVLHEHGIGIKICWSQLEKSGAIMLEGFKLTELSTSAGQSS